MSTPHARHLREMRASVRDTPQWRAWWQSEVRRIRAQIAGDVAADMERGRVSLDEEIAMCAAYPDPTRRHLAEMRRLTHGDGQ
jgi:hypothetical protein